MFKTFVTFPKIYAAFWWGRSTHVQCITKYRSNRVFYLGLGWIYFLHPPLDLGRVRRFILGRAIWIIVFSRWRALVGHHTFACGVRVLYARCCWQRNVWHGEAENGRWKKLFLAKAIVCRWINFAEWWFVHLFLWVLKFKPFGAKRRCRSRITYARARDEGWMEDVAVSAISQLIASGPRRA